MTIADRWLLPDGIEEILPPEAKQIEQLRRDLLDLFHHWGYDLVIPPQVEFLESLLTGTGHDLELQTFKVTDQISGRMMGLSADITPQVARMDAHSLRREGPARLCYVGSVLHTKAGSLLSTRSPISVGAELFGSAELNSDLEILSLMIDTLKKANCQTVHLDLGHVAVYRELMASLNISEAVSKDLFETLQHKHVTEYEQLVRDKIAPMHQELLLPLPALTGGYEVIEKAEALYQAYPKVIEALAEINLTARAIQKRYPEITLYFDLAELRGYNYHTGLVFAAYVPNFGEAIAKGGRYDETGAVFGRARPATGFTTDLKKLAAIHGLPPMPKDGIYAPVSDDDSIFQAIQTLRAQGERVIQGLADEGVAATQLSCNRTLVKSGNEWKVESL